MSIYKYKKLVEDSYILELSNFPKKFHHSEHNISGTIRLTKFLCEVNLQYSILPARIDPYIEISFCRKGIIKKQRILYDIENNYFGIRPYLFCACGYRGNKLYMHMGDQAFTCKSCAGLSYQLTTMNRKVLGNELFYRANRLMKLAEAETKYITYGNKLTRRAKSFIKKHKKWCIGPKEKERIDIEISQLTGKSQFI